MEINLTLICFINLLFICFTSIVSDILNSKNTFQLKYITNNYIYIEGFLYNTSFSII